MAVYKIHNNNVTSDLAWVNHYSRITFQLIVDAPYFKDYLAHFRAKELYYCFATAGELKQSRWHCGFSFGQL